MFTNGLVVGAVMDFAGGDVVVQLISFLLLLWAIKKFAWGPLMKMMKDREEFVSNEIDNAEKSRLEAAKLLEEQRALLKEARTDAQELIDRAKQQADAQRETIMDDARKDAERLKMQL